MKFTFVFLDLLMEKLALDSAFILELPIYGLTWVTPSSLVSFPFPSLPPSHTHTLRALLSGCFPIHLSLDSIGTSRGLSAQ